MSETQEMQEAKEMQGTEFLYCYRDGDIVPAFVARVGFTEAGNFSLTCKTLTTESRDGWRGQEPEADGTWCVVSTVNEELILYILELIECHGTLYESEVESRLADQGMDNAGGAPSCNF